MLDFHWGIVDSIKKNLQGIFQTTMLAPFLFFKCLVPDTKKENITDIICYLFNYSCLLLPHNLIHQ